MAMDNFNRYNPIVKEFQKWNVDFSETDNRRLTAPISYNPTVKALTAYWTYSFVYVTCPISIEEAIKAFSVLWKKKLFTQISLPVRFIFEMWAATHYAENVMKKVQNTSQKKELHNYVQLIDRLTMGSRYPIPDFIGNPIKIQSLNVMTYIDKLNDDLPGARDMYDYLCVSCHPTVPQLFYWGTMYPDFNNNDVFRDHGHDMIQRTLDIMRTALKGAKTDIETTFKICLDIEETEREKQ